MASAERWARRIGWLLLAAASLVLFLFVNNTATRCVAALAIGLPLCSLLTLCLPRPKLSASLTLPERLSRNDAARAALLLESESLLPRRVLCALTLQNAMTGETETVPLACTVRRGKPFSYGLELLPTHCGALTLRLSRAQCPDPLGLFARRLPVEADAAGLVLPEQRPLTVRLEDAADFLQDSSTVASQRPGYDPAETVRIRDYVPGDPIRQIHWKLSEKTEKLLVRDFGLPVVSQLLLLFETAAPRTLQYTPDDADALLALLHSAAAALLAEGQCFTLAWQDAQGVLRTETVDTRAAWDAALAALLQSPLRRGERSVVGCYAAQQPECAFAHASVFSTYAAAELDAISRGNLVTVLLPERCAGDVAASGAFRVRCFHETTSTLEL